MNGEPGDDATENVRALIVFPLAHEWKQVLLMHGCTLGEDEYGETVIFPEDTTRTLLLSRTGRATNRYRIQLPDGLELREVLDDEGRGKSWLLLILSQEPMQDVNARHDHLQRRTRVGEETEEERRAARRIAYNIAAHTIQQAVYDEFLRSADSPRMLVIYELHIIAGQLEKEEQQIIETGKSVQK
jgi:hypothetical protein